MSDIKFDSLRSFFRVRAQAVSTGLDRYLEPLFDEAKSAGLTTSRSSFKRHYMLWRQYRETPRQAPHMPPPVTGHALGQFAGATA